MQASDTELKSESRNAFKNNAVQLWASSIYGNFSFWKVRGIIRRLRRKIYNHLPRKRLQTNLSNFKTYFLGFSFKHQHYSKLLLHVFVLFYIFHRFAAFWNRADCPLKQLVQCNKCNLSEISWNVTRLNRI